MEPIDHVLGAMTVEEAHYVRIAARAPWGIAFPSRHLARLILVSCGSCLLTGAGLDEPQPLTGGDCLLVRAGATFELRDASGRGLVDCEEIDKDGTRVGVTGGDGLLTEIASSRFTVDPIAADALFALLPPLTRLRLDRESGPLLRTTFDLIARETASHGPGSGLVVGKLSEVLFVQALRACFDGASSKTTGWIAALSDPQLASAMAALHADIAHPWSVAELAREAGMSRSTFAAAFRERAGDTPLGYLTTWRMYRAKRLLRETARSVDEIAPDVGYRTGQALSRAFLQHEGIAPGTWRRTSARELHAASRTEDHLRAAPLLTDVIGGRGRADPPGW